MASENIFAQFAQPVRSVADYMGDMDARDLRRQQLIGSQRQNALSALVAQQQTESMARNALVQSAQRKAAETAGGDETAYVKNLRLSGMPELIDPADKVDKALTERGKAKSENGKRDTETENAVVSQWRDMIGMAVSPEHAAKMVAAMHSDPRISNTPMAKVPLDQAMAMLQQTPFDQWKQQFALGATKFVEMNKPTYQQQNLGGTMQTLALPGMGGAPTVAASAPITQSADNRAKVGASMANAAALRDQAQATRDAATIQTGFKNESDLRKEFEGLPEVKNYKQAYPAFAAIKDAATRSTPQADINMVYGIAKLYDPTSVVREGEYATVANSPNIPERIKGYAQYIAGGGKLSEETKRQIVAEANSRIQSYQGEVVKARKSYGGIAQQRGMNPAAVFQSMGDEPGAGVDAPKPAAEVKAKNAKGWTLHTDAKGNKAYVSPDGKQFEEVK